MNVTTIEELSQLACDPERSDELKRILGVTPGSRPDRGIKLLLRTLGESDRPEAVVVLVSALRSEDPHVRNIAAGALGDQRTSTAADALINTLSTGSPKLDAIVAESLGRIGDIRAVPALTDLLGQHADAVTRSAAARALGRMPKGTTRTTAVLVAALSDEDRMVRGTAAQALEILGATEAVDELRRLARRERFHPIGRRPILRALSRLDSP